MAGPAPDRAWSRHALSHRSVTQIRHDRAARSPRGRTDRTRTDPSRTLKHMTGADSRVVDSRSRSRARFASLTRSHKSRHQSAPPARRGADRKRALTHGAILAKWHPGFDVSMRCTAPGAVSRQSLDTWSRRNHHDHLPAHHCRRHAHGSASLCWPTRRDEARAVTLEARAQEWAAHVPLGGESSTPSSSSSPAMRSMISFPTSACVTSRPRNSMLNFTLSPPLRNLTACFFRTP